MKRKLTTVTDIKLILRHYDIGMYRNKRYIDITIENQNFKVRTTKGMFLLKVFDSKDVANLQFQNDVLEYLRKAQAKVPTVIRNRNGSSLTAYKNKYLSIYEFIEGKHLGSLSPALCKNLAQETARLHLALLKYRPRDISKKISAHAYTKEDLQWLKKYKLRQCVIHADLGRLNTLVRKNRITAFVDFGDARWDFLAKDLAVLTTSLLTKKDVKYISIFYKEYQRSIKLKKGERESLPFLISKHIRGVLGWLEKVSREKQSRDRLVHIKKGMQEFRQKLIMLESMPLK